MCSLLRYFTTGLAARVHRILLEANIRSLCDIFTDRVNQMPKAKSPLRVLTLISQIVEVEISDEFARHASRSTLYDLMILEEEDQIFVLRAVAEMLKEVSPDEEYVRGPDLPQPQFPFTEHGFEMFLRFDQDEPTVSNAANSSLKRPRWRRGKSIRKILAKVVRGGKSDI